ncbi:MAG: hypothetical protein ABIA97_02510 [Candidatus Omnitrophota bacterium]
MKFKIISLAYLFIFLLLVNLTGVIFAYDCIPPTIEACYKGYSDYIFTAKVLSSGEQEGIDADAQTKYVIEVLDVYKGSLEEKVDVYRETYWGDIFVVGEEYLIFAKTADNKIVVPVCSRTLPLRHDYAKEYIEKLGQIINEETNVEKLSPNS